MCWRPRHCGSASRKNMRISVDGTLAPGVHAKDVILAIIARIGTAGGSGHVIEYAGSTIRALSIEGRLTVCNMSIEAGARAGMVAPDDTTFAYLAGRPYAPKGADWDKALALWRSLPSDADARFDREVHLDAAEIAPMVTWGTSPEAAAPITRARSGSRPTRRTRRGATTWSARSPIWTSSRARRSSDIAIDRVFLGSCTNSRIEDLRIAAKLADGRRAVVPAMVVPGLGAGEGAGRGGGAGRDLQARRLRVARGRMLDVRRDERRPGGAGERCASTSNRNFVGRQGKGARTHLVSPAMAVAAAVTGKLTDVRRLLTRE